MAHPKRERRGTGRPLPVSSSEGVSWCVAEALGPGSNPLARPVDAARRGAGGWRQLPGAGGRRGSATVTAAAGSRAEARAREGRGCRARRGPELPASSRAGRWWSRSQAVAAPAKQGWPLGSLSREPTRSGERSEPTRVRLSARLSLAHIEPPPPTQAPALRLATPASATSRTQSRQPSLPASLDFPDGAMLFFQDNQGSSPPGDLSRRPPPEIPRRFPPRRY